MDLLPLVRPPDWRNPTPVPLYDLVVIGAGTAGLVCAAGAAGLGARVALIERALLGGECLHTGCVPSKALLRAARTVAEARRGDAVGVSAATSVDFPAVMQRLRASQVTLAPNDSAERFSALGVDVFFGEAAFADKQHVIVAGQSLRFRRAVIATGSEPVVPSISFARGARVVTTDDVFTVTTLPRRMLVIGAGPVGCELAQAFALLGASVTLTDVNSRVLPGEDPEASASIARALERSGVTLAVGDQQGASDFDLVLVATGRRPRTAGLNLEAAGVASGDLGVVVDDHLRTTNRRVFAAGDVCARERFTHAADAMARIVVQNALFFGRARVSALVIPRCTYTLPEVASVGANEGEAITVPLDEVDRAVIDAEADGFIRIRHRRGIVTGATVVAPHAGEVIGHIAHVIARRGSVADFAGVIFPYPTLAAGLRRAGDVYRRGRLTPRVQRLLRGYFAVFRR